MKYGSYKVKIINKKYLREEIWVRMLLEGEIVLMVYFRVGREWLVIDVFYYCLKLDLGFERSCIRLKFDILYEIVYWFLVCSEKV